MFGLYDKINIPHCVIAWNIRSLGLTQTSLPAADIKGDVPTVDVALNIADIA